MGHWTVGRGNNYSCFFGKRNYRVLVRVCVCVSVCVCVCACVHVCMRVFLHDNSEKNRSRDTIYKNSSDEFDIEHHWIMVKLTVGLQKFSPFTRIQTVRSYNLTLLQASKLILSM